MTNGTSPNLHPGGLLPPLAAWLGGMLLVFSPGIFSGFRLILGGLGDVRLINYTLEHGYRWVAGFPLHRNFWSPPIFYPVEGVSAYTDVLLAVGPFYWVWRWLGFQPDVAFHLWALVMWSLNFAAAWWLLSRLFGFDRVAAAAGSFLFAFGAWRGRNVMHQQLIPNFYLLASIFALCALFAAEEEDQPRWWSPLWIGVFVAGLVLQAWTAFYPVFFYGLALGVALLGAVALAGSRRRLFAHLERRWAIWLLAGLVAAASLFPLASRYVAASGELGLRDYEQTRLPHPMAWVLMGQTNRLYGWLQEPGGPFRHLRQPSQSSGVGPITTLVAIAGLASLRRRRAVQLMALAAGVLILAATMLPGGFSLWSLLHRFVPGAAALRAVGRIGMILILPAAVGVAAFFDRRSGWTRRWIVVAIAAVCLAEQVHDIAWRDRDDLRRHVADIAARVPDGCEAFYLVARDRRRYKQVHDDAAWAALRAGIPTVNGRYGNFPPGWRLHASYIKKRKQEVRLREELARWIRVNRLDPAGICWVETRRFQ